MEASNGERAAFSGLVRPSAMIEKQQRRSMSVERNSSAINQFSTRGGSRAPSVDRSSLIGQGGRASSVEPANQSKGLFSAGAKTAELDVPLAFGK